MESFLKRDLHDFVTAHTINFFTRFGICSNFLKEDPLIWNENENYNNAKKFVQLNLNVVNDAAERAVKLIEEYNKVLTKKEEEKQYLLQVVTDYRKNYKYCTKTALAGSLS